MKVILFASLVGLIAWPAFAASPFNGTWVVSLGTVQPPDKPNEFLLQDGKFSCSSCAPAFTVPADGAAHAITGNPYFDNVTIKVADARTIVETQSKGAKVLWVYTMRVSDDGKGMTTEMIDNSAVNGVPARGTIIQVRDKEAPAGAHLVSGTWHATKYEGYSDSALTLTLRLLGEKLTFSQPTGQFYSARLGGRAAPYKGDPGITTVRVARSGPDTIVETDMRDGKIVSTNTMTTSDGKTMEMIFVDKVRNSTQKLTAIRQ